MSPHMGCGYVVWRGAFFLPFRLLLSGGAQTNIRDSAPRLEQASGIAASPLGPASLDLGFLLDLMWALDDIASGFPKE